MEDFEILARTLGTGLRREGLAVDVVLDGTTALERLAVTDYDVAVLDRDVPASTATRCAAGSRRVIRPAAC